MALPDDTCILRDVCRPATAEQFPAATGAMEGPEGLCSIGPGADAFRIQVASSRLPATGWWRLLIDPASAAAPCSTECAASLVHRLENADGVASKLAVRLDR